MTDLEGAGSGVGIGQGILDDLCRHAEREYPDECCGFLIGTPSPPDAVPQIERIVPVPNRAAADRATRYAIEPGDLADLEEQLEPKGQTVLGFYHSHPDRETAPSAHDTELAWPGYLYVIVAVAARKAGEVAAFALRPGRDGFQRLRLLVAVPPSAAPNARGEALTAGRE